MWLSACIPPYSGLNSMVKINFFNCLQEYKFAWLQIGKNQSNQLIFSNLKHFIGKKRINIVQINLFFIIPE